MSSVDFLKSSSREYALYVNDDRAIPYVGDGLKHVQRVALWMMRNEPDKVKVIALVGRLADAGLYVHGDVACGDAISLLAAPFRNNIPLLKGEGQFGSRCVPGKEGIGAARYVSVKRSKAAMKLLYCDTDVVPMEENYDGSNQQPVHFLPLIPLVLLNGVSGIGVGYSTDILPRKLEDLVAATAAVVAGKKPKELVPYWEGYDIDVRKTGAPNQWELTGKATVVNSSTVRITELPPGLALEAFRARLIDLEDTDQIVRFVDSSSDRIDITVTFKRGTIAKWTEKDALKFFKLHEKTTERIVVRKWDGDGLITYDDPHELIRDFVQWRLGWYSARYRKLIADDDDELSYWKLILALIEGGFTQCLGKFANRKEVDETVRAVAEDKGITASDQHVNRAVSLPTYRWTLEFDAEVKKKIQELEAKIADYKSILASPERIQSIYASELKDVRL